MMLHKFDPSPLCHIKMTFTDNFLLSVAEFNTPSPYIRDVYE